MISDIRKDAEIRMEKCVEAFKTKSAKFARVVLLRSLLDGIALLNTTVPDPACASWPASPSKTPVTLKINVFDRFYVRGR